MKFMQTPIQIFKTFLRPIPLRENHVEQTNIAWDKKKFFVFFLLFFFFFFSFVLPFSCFHPQNGTRANYLQVKSHLLNQNTFELVGKLNRSDISLTLAENFHRNTCPDSVKSSKWVYFFVVVSMDIWSSTSSQWIDNFVVGFILFFIKHLPLNCVPIHGRYEFQLHFS